MSPLAPIVLSRWPRGQHPGTVEYDLASGASFVSGELVGLDGSGDVIAASGTNPNEILGIAAEDSANVLFSGKVLVYEASETEHFMMVGDRDPVAGDVAVEYGLDKTGSYHLVDTTNVATTRVLVIDVNIPRKVFFCKVLSAYRQA